MSTIPAETPETRERLKEEKAFKQEVGERKCSKCKSQMQLGYLRPMNAKWLDDYETEVLWDGGDASGALHAVDVWACLKCGGVEFVVVFPRDLKVAGNPVSFRGKAESSYCSNCFEPVVAGVGRCLVCGKVVKPK